MKKIAFGTVFKQLFKSLVAMFLFLSCVLLATEAELHAFTLNVEGCTENNVCTPLPVGFRWLLEEDNTTQSPPGVRVPDSVGLTVNNSHAPVAASGAAFSSSTVIAVPDATKKYFISVLPSSGYSNGGSMVYANNGTVTVKVSQHDLPMAQVSVLIFKDHNPINNVYDTGEEVVPGASILIFDQGGQMSLDACGNPLGTSYSGGSCGNVTAMGNGVILTGPDGVAIIKNLFPGKYGIRAVPPGNSADWVQTSTIEGTPGIDAWVKANEPTLFIEGFGTGFYHAFIGFVKPAELPWAGGGPGGSTISGQNVFNHFGRPPVNQGFFEGPPVNECWVGLNNPTTRQGLMAVPCDGNSNFTLTAIPANTYTLVTWDKPLDALFGFHTVTVGTGAVNLGKVLSFRWFGTLEGSVFYDANQNGFRDAGETGIAEQNINLRFRDGSMYQAQPTDASGEYSFSEVFPFFKWIVTEVDFARFKATGMTTAVDYGGAIPPENGWLTPSFGKLNPQPQATVNPNTGNNLSRTETGPVLTQAMQLYLNQTNVIDWGKTTYATGENGGISGIVFYDTTRAENDPRYNGGETWQPGIPRVQVCLYQDNDMNGIIDNKVGTPAGVQLCDVDNYPFGWSDGSAPKGLEDVTRSGDGVNFSMGDAIDLATTDSWDDNKPTGCIQDLPPIPGVQPCFDNYATWNQVRPGIFDGGYAFGPNLPAGQYIVEAVPPASYLVVKEEDKNVDFGDAYKPSLLLVPPVCVGTTANGMPSHTVPSALALFPGVAIDPPLAGSVTPLCSMKQVSVTTGNNAAADFFLFTEVPKAARVVGFKNNDLSAEFNAGSPIFGEKTSASWIPVSMQDWQGHEVARVYTDEWGSYNAMLPSTYTMNAPMPTGVSPNMLTAVLNHPFLPNGSLDPYYDPRYSVTPWTLDYWPGKTTYLDTPLVPVAAFTGYPQNGPDVDAADHTPLIDSVSGTQTGPVVCGTLPQTATITAMGPTAVPNPAFNPVVSGSQSQITRDYGFGSTEGTVTLNGTPLEISSWSATSITVNVTSGTTGQLLVTRGDNNATTPVGITFHVLPSCTTVRHATPGPGAIQAAVDAAANGDLIIVDPGTYQENVILYKNVKLQGSGAGSTLIFANPSPAEKLAAWHAKVQSIFGSDPFLANEAPGVLVLGGFGAYPVGPSLVDGIEIMGTIMGGGIAVYDNSPGIQISNNRITGNQGNFAGGIAIGTPTALSNNPNATITNNQIIRNGGVQGGGGVSLYGGATNYNVQNNIIGANFSRFNGGGVSHVGPSNGQINNNAIIFNEVAFGGLAFSDGAGIYIGADAVTGSPGNVTIDANLIQGNLAGVGSGAGIRAIGTGAASLSIINNMIVNNAAGYQGGGISLTGADNASIINNTIANNDSTATAALAFAAGAVDSTPQAAGMVADTSTPVLRNNIIWNNRSFYTTNGGAGGLLPNPAGPVWDLQLLGGAGQLNPEYSILTTLNPPDGSNYTGNGNISANPAFVTSYLNQIVTAAVIDEGGNFITVRFTPLVASTGNYHITAVSPAVDQGTATGAPATDIDTEARPNGAGFDIGADEMFVGTVPPGPVSGIGVFDNGTWYIDTNRNGAYDPSIDSVYTFVAPGTIPVTGDWNGDGSTKIGVYNPATAQWYLDFNGNGLWDGTPTDRISWHGFSGVTPVTGDWNGDGFTKIGVYDPATAQWFLDYNGNGLWDGTPTDRIYWHGFSGVTPVTGDWNGDGTTKIGVYDPATAQWFLDYNGNGLWDGTPTDRSYWHGFSGVTPVTADWNGDGITEIGVYNPATAQWYLDYNGNGLWDGTPTDRIYWHGFSGVTPVTGNW